MNPLTKAFFYILGVFFLTACSSSKPLTLHMAVEKGANFNYEITTTNDLGFSVMGQDMSTTGQMVSDYNFLVREVQPSGVTDVDFKIQKMTLNQSVPMLGDVAYDSSKKEEDKDSPFNGLNGMIGKTMTASFNRQGEVTNLEGVQQILGEVMDKMKSGGQAKQLIDNFIGEGAIKKSLNMLTGFSQGKPLKPGDSWNSKSEASGSMALLTEHTYTIRERKNGTTIIDVTGTAKTNSKAEPVEIQGMKISYDLSGPVTGIIIVDEKTGWAKTSDIQQNLSGKMMMGGTPMGDMSLDAKMKIGIAAKRM